MRKVPEETIERIDAESPPESAIRSAPTPDVTTTKPDYIVAIGGSAGGLEAFEHFLTGIPPDTGMAFIIIQHLDPTHESLLTDLLQRATAMPVREATDGMPIEPNNVYVIPPNSDLTVRDDLLCLHKPAAPRGVRMPVDSFFESLAAEQGDKSIAIIVSGMGTDGTLGLKAVKEASGVVMVQDPDSARFDGMPRSAINTGLVDYVAPIEGLPNRLVAYVTHSSLLGKDEGDEKRHLTALKRILQLLAAHTKHDFSLYKKSTLYRRIAKRASLLQIDGISEYAGYVEEHPEELDVLFQEFLIGVTKFFRDPGAWDYLENSVIPDMVNRAAKEGAVRVWVAGCSTGEEAFSIAILIREVIDKVQPSTELKIQIFGTDIDERAIDVARKAVYPANIAADVSPERLSRFFTEFNGSYRVNKLIRETVVFAPHDLLKDPPFTKMDMVSCRNLMIYFSPELQKVVMPKFHYALNPNGILILGTAESTSSSPELFASLDNKWKVFSRRDGRVLPTRTAGTSIYRPVIRTQKEEGIAVEPVTEVSEAIRRVLFDKYAPPSVIVHPNGDIVYVSGRTGKYLEPAEGGASLNICTMARTGLREELPNAIYRANTQKADIALKGLRVKTNGDYETIDVTISPLPQAEPLSGLLMVVFQDAVPTETPVIRDIGEVPCGELDTRLALAEQELARTKEHLHGTVEEMEATQEELRSANEELQSTNEEVQSTNEELITSKEEMQSLNEELITLNNELETRVDDLTILNNDMANLMNSTQIATIFLDAKLQVKRFTPAVVSMFNLRSIDVGRPITDITQNLKYETIGADIDRVLQTLIVEECEVEGIDGRWYIMRIMPYRTLDGAVDGIVITFSEVTSLKQLEDVLRTSGDLSRALNEISAEISASLDSDHVLPVVVKRSSAAIGVEAAMITVLDNSGWVVQQTFGLQKLLPGMRLTDEDIPYLKLVRETGDPVAIADVSNDDGVSRSIAEAYEMRSALGIPLITGGEVLGVLSLICTSKTTVFRDTEIDFARKLGTALSLALNNIRLYVDRTKAKNDAEDARHTLLEHHNLLQQALLPTQLYETPGYRLATKFVPGAAGKYIGGDFYDVFEIEDGRVAILIGDVSGKGVEAASLAVATRSTIRSFAYEFGSPSKALTHANAVIYSQSRFPERFATVLLAILDPSTGQINYASGGHPPAVIRRVDGSVELLSTGQFPVGIEDHADYTLSDSQLNPGDMLIMYTDGISESHKGLVMYDIEGIQATLEQCVGCKAESAIELLFKAATDVSGGLLGDDAAVIAIERDA